MFLTQKSREIDAVFFKSHKKQSPNLWYNISKMASLSFNQQLVIHEKYHVFASLISRNSIRMNKENYFVSLFKTGNFRYVSKRHVWDTFLSNHTMEKHWTKIFI